ncbi:MAG: hypothetical protein QMC95_04780 [Desulfitobacteriaceae bacterium]|nr:hypothetical protein [Desulfitobacteriaceae bacterium]MDI6913516.1 hypothetical protein [Desulfitobacteriaceae bacterium]
MCGGRGWGGFFGWGGCGGGYFEPYSHHHHGDSHGHHKHERQELLEEIRTLYASGYLTRVEYYDTLERLERGRFTWVDLKELRAQKSRSYASDDETKLPERDPSIQRELSGLEHKKAAITREKTQTAKLLQEIEHSFQTLEAQMADAEQRAKDVVNQDENQARAFLRQRQELVGQLGGLGARQQELSEALTLLEAAESKLQTKILELQALGQKEKLTRLANSL